MRREWKKWMSALMAGAMAVGSLSGFAFAEEAADEGVVSFEEIAFPETMPSNPTLAEDGYYDYDDMSVHYDLEFFTYNYGSTIPDEDPIKDYLEEKYNVTITMTTSAQADMETILSTRFADGDVPDLITLPTSNGQQYGFTLGEQGLLLDAKEIYPYLPQTCKFTTQTLISYSTMEDGTIPFFTKYSIQDGDVWSYAIRQDWLDALGMEVPTTKEELLEYAKACTFNDPDGNGEDDTYFMLTGGGGSSLQMMVAFEYFFGPTAEHEEDGVLVSPMLDGTVQNFVSFLNELYEANVFAPDWYTMDWETAKSYTMKDRIGMVNYPAGALYQEYVNSNGGDYSLVENWTFLAEAPIEGGKWGPGGNPGVLFAIPSSLSEDMGKVMRICHIMDAMCYGGEDYFTTVQGGWGADIFPDYTDDIRQYNEDGTSICYVAPTHPGYTEYGTDNLGLAHWQNFGYTLKWQVEYSDGEDEKYEQYVNAINEANIRMTQYDRWPNYALEYTVSGDVAPNLSEFENAQLYKFITGERSMEEWDTYVDEWMAQGGKARCEAIAEQLGCELPEELQ